MPDEAMRMVQDGVASPEVIDMAMALSCRGSHSW
jgi:3-hydroxyacyl-CoA dehydrogenase